jgi:hypothetical protein
MPEAISIYDDRSSISMYAVVEKATVLDDWDGSPIAVLKTDL